MSHFRRPNHAPTIRNSRRPQYFQGDKNSPCAVCNQPTHHLGTCVLSPSKNGRTPGCPVHNTLEHSLDACPDQWTHTAEARLFWQVKRRNGRPELESRINWRSIPGAAASGYRPLSVEYAHSIASLLRDHNHAVEENHLSPFGDPGWKDGTLFAIGRFVPHVEELQDLKSDKDLDPRKRARTDEPLPPAKRIRRDDNHQFRPYAQDTGHEAVVEWQSANLADAVAEVAKWKSEIQQSFSANPPLEGFSRRTQRTPSRPSTTHYARNTTHFAPNAASTARTSQAVNPRAPLGIDNHGPGRLESISQFSDRHPEARNAADDMDGRLESMSQFGYRQHDAHDMQSTASTLPKS